jgi:hypothetical protein
MNFGIHTRLIFCALRYINDAMERSKRAKELAKREEEQADAASLLNVIGLAEDDSGRDLLRKHREYILDLGMGLGADSLFYLHSGYYVVGVEGNPKSAARIKTEFRDEIWFGQMTLLNAAIVPEDPDEPTRETGFSNVNMYSMCVQNMRESTIWNLKS